LQEAAIVDGASYWGIYWNIMLPLSRPILSALAVFFFLISMDLLAILLTKSRLPVRIVDTSDL
jgi:multiple sugar transport system permease protein